MIFFIIENLVPSKKNWWVRKPGARMITKFFYKVQPQPETATCRQLLSAFDHKSTYDMYQVFLLIRICNLYITVFTRSTVLTNDKARLSSFFF